MTRVLLKCLPEKAWCCQDNSVYSEQQPIWVRVLLFFKRGLWFECFSSTEKPHSQELESHSLEIWLCSLGMAQKVKYLLFKCKDLRLISQDTCKARNSKMHLNLSDSPVSWELETRKLSDAHRHLHTHQQRETLCQWRWKGSLRPRAVLYLQICDVGYVHKLLHKQSVHRYAYTTHMYIQWKF